MQNTKVSRRERIKKKKKETNLRRKLVYHRLYIDYRSVEKRREIASLVLLAEENGGSRKQSRNPSVSTRPINHCPPRGVPDSRQAWGWGLTHRSPIETKDPFAASRHIHNFLPSFSLPPVIMIYEGTRPGQLILIKTQPCRARIWCERVIISDQANGG